jgi:hypothetical protein
MKNPFRLLLVAALLAAPSIFLGGNSMVAAGGLTAGTGAYRVLAPIQSGRLLLFPVVRASGDSPKDTPFITLDEGFKSGEVEVTEAGNVRGLVRPRPGISGQHPIPSIPYRGDQVNTLVLVNHSKKPLLLLAGEIVTGGKQDRVIAKDRIVPPDADPIDLSVFCIEPGRWTGETNNFSSSNKSQLNSFMVQPSVRVNAMAKQDQQKVWDSVNGAVSQMALAAAPRASAGVLSESVTVQASGGPLALNTSSYAKAMNNKAVSAEVDQAAAPANEEREQVLAKLRDEHAVGVVVAVRGKLIWADLFANTDLLARYWTKLVRSYAAESVTESDDHEAPSVADAQRFLELSAAGHETSEGDVGIYRYSEMHGDGNETFILESLLPNADYEVHISKMKLRDNGDRVWIERPRPVPNVHIDPIR